MENNLYKETRLSCWPAIIKTKQKLLALLIFLIMTGTNQVFGQILTFETSALSGDEVSTTSNSNDANLTSSILSRGSRLNASTNSGRFNSTNHSTNVTLDTGDNSYFNFNVTPNSEYKFSITSIVFNFQRSATGPKSFALRSSNDSYSSDLGSIVTIADTTTTQILTFTFTLNDITSNTEFRLYTYNAELPAGSGGIGDGSGDDLIINGSTGTTGGVASKLAVIKINGGNSPSNGTAFDVVVQAQDASSLPANVTAYVDITLTLATGNGSLGGTLTGTLTNGNSKVTISGVTYNTSESGVSITASDDASNLTSGISSTFTVLDAASKLAIKSFPTEGNTNVTITPFTVEAQRSDNSVDGNFSGNITLSKATGSGNLGGTLTKAAFSGIAIFYDITFDAADDYTITAIATGLTSATSSSISILTIVPPTPSTVFITEVADATSSFNNEFMELYNAGTDDIDASSITIYRYASEAIEGSAAEVSVNLSSLIGSKIIPAGGFLVVARGANQSGFESEWGSLPAKTNFNVGNTNLYFGVNRGWSIRDGSTQLDSTYGPVANLNRHFQTYLGSKTFSSDDRNNATPGVLETQVTISGTAGWRALSSPKSGFKVEDISDNTAIQGITGGSDAGSPSNFYLLNSANFSTPASLTTPISDGLGYVVYFFNNTTNGSSVLPLTLDMTGSEPSSDVTVNLYNGASGQFTLVGNPFAMNINTNSITVDAGAIQNNIWFWNDGGNTFVSQDRTSGFIVAPWQGFWVETSDATVSSITIPTSAKTASDATATYFSKQIAETTPTYEIPFILSTEVNQDHALKLVFRDDATEGWDLSDATKPWPLLSSFVNLAFVNSENPDHLKGVESLPLSFEHEIYRELTVVSRGVTGEVSLQWESTTLPKGLDLHLTDRMAGVTFSLHEQSTYEFTIASNQKANPIENIKPGSRLTSDGEEPRFLLTISGDVTTSTETTIGLPKAVELSQNYPNPFNPTTTIRYALPQTSAVTLEIFNMLGQKIVTIVNGQQASGSHTVSWNASGLSSGIYYYRLSAGSTAITKTMTLIK